MTAPLKIPAPAPLPRELRQLGAELNGVPRLDDEIEDEATLMWRGSNLPGNRISGFAAPEAARFAFGTAEGKEEDSTLITKPDLADPRIMRSDRPPAPREPSSSVRPVAGRSSSARPVVARRISSVPSTARPASSRPIVAPPASPRPILASPISAERNEASALIPAAALALLGQTTRAAAEAQAAAAASLLHPPRSAPPVPRQVLAEPPPQPESAENTPPPVPASHLVSSLRPSASSDWDEQVVSMARPRRRWLGAVAVGVVAAVAATVVVMNPEQSAVLVDRLVASGAALVASVR